MMSRVETYNFPPEPEVGDVANDEVIQDASLNLVTVPVTVEGAVQVRELPAREAGFATLALTTAGSRVLSPDPLRKLSILTPTAAIVLSSSQSGLSTGAAWPANTPLILGASSEVWAKAASGTANISMITERWA